MWVYNPSRPPKRDYRANQTTPASTRATTNNKQQTTNNKTTNKQKKEIGGLKYCALKLVALNALGNW